ncbi:sigma-70 family RNA polymerase sigma factor [Aureivirga sp. CE67]|uniref:sigma-70 family RNA polymerase sigma factor n=1 Tax=Aureivirga sp. CE67 TaxID=1788983 RepID=UPI0018CAC12A|nr:sigma-70 family RNA polymerase sigma factor [Aureivirga sp. CE67]
MAKNNLNINEIVQHFYDYLKAFILSKVNNKELAEDLVQEVMVKLVESHQKEIEITNVKAWLFKVTRNTIYDYFKSHKLEIDLEENINLFDEIKDSESKLMTTDYIIPMIDLLPEKFSLPLKMSDIENISQKEIAEKLDLGLSATKMRIKRARVQLHQLFIECCVIEYDKNGAFVGCSIRNSCDDLHKITSKLNKLQK